jgi:hypothetical protein
MIEDDAGYAAIYGRITAINGYRISLYGFSINQDGKWILYISGTEPNFSTTVLASGSVYDFKVEQWHELKLIFKGSGIKAFIDGSKVADVVNDRYNEGMAGLGSGWNNARFNCFNINPCSEEVKEEVKKISYITGIDKIEKLEIVKDIDGYTGMAVRVGDFDISVDELGRYCLDGNKEIHEMKIIGAADGEELGSLLLAMNEGEKDENGFKYSKFINPVKLYANMEYYIVSKEFAGKDCWYGVRPSHTSCITTGNAAEIISSVNYEDGIFKRDGDYAKSLINPISFKYF